MEVGEREEGRERGREGGGEKEREGAEEGGEIERGERVYVCVCFRANEIYI